MAKLVSLKFMRSVRVVGRAMAFAGLAIVAMVVLYMASNPVVPTTKQVRVQVIILFVGLAMNQIGILKLGEKKAFNGRRYVALRELTDDFIGLVRRLNSHVLADDDRAADELVEEMYGVIHKIRGAAGLSVTQEQPRLVLADQDGGAPAMASGVAPDNADAER